MLAVETNSVSTLLAFLVNDESFEVATGQAYKFEAALAFVDTVKFEHIEL